MWRGRGGRILGWEGNRGIGEAELRVREDGRGTCEGEDGGGLSGCG